MIDFESLPPPEAANDNDVRLGRRGGESYIQALARAKSASRLRAPDRESPLAKAFRDGRVPPREAGDMALVAEFVAIQFENAVRRGGIPVPSARKSAGMPIERGGDPLNPVGQEITVDARRDVWAMQDAAGDAWSAVQMAVLDRATMETIGLAYGTPFRRAAKVGLEHVVTGLRRIERGVLLLPERRFLAAVAA
jgi:hypothetical protein